MNGHKCYQRFLTHQPAQPRGSWQKASSSDQSISAAPMLTKHNQYAPSLHLKLAPAPRPSPGVASGFVPPSPSSLPLPDLTSIVVESPGAKSTPIELAVVALSCSAVRSGLLRASHDGRPSFCSMLFVTEMGTSKIV